MRTFLHWDGAALRVVDSSATGAIDLGALWAFTPSDAWVGGNSGFIARWNGASWTTTPHGSSAALTGTWGFSPTDLWAVGSGGAVLHFDGGWTEEPPVTTATLRDVWGSSASNVYAVGNLPLVVIRREGTTWAIDDTPPGPLFAVWGASAAEVWAAGESGLIRVRDAAGVWDTHRVAGSGPTLRDLAGTVLRSR